jgi:hypothetical protein
LIETHLNPQEYLIDVIETEANNDIMENTLRFYATYLSKISSMNNTKSSDSISFLYDVKESTSIKHFYKYQ